MKNAVSLIIGPQPASYQPTDPSSNLIIRIPPMLCVGGIRGKLENGWFS
jgi:hypothetical protein